jgi:hypothetical protein
MGFVERMGDGLIHLDTSVGMGMLLVVPLALIVCKNSLTIRSKVLFLTTMRWGDILGILYHSIPAR